MANLLGETIRKRRESLRITQEELGKRIGVEATTVSLYESATRRPKFAILKKISSELGISLAALMDIEISKTDLDIALRANDLKPGDIEEVRRYIQLIINARKHT